MAKQSKLLAQFKRKSVVTKTEIEELRAEKRSNAFYHVIHQVVRDLAEDIVERPESDSSHSREPYVFAHLLGEFPEGRLYLYEGVRPSTQPVPDKPPVLGEGIELTAGLCQSILAALDNYQPSRVAGFSGYPGIYACRYGYDPVRLILITAENVDEAVKQAFRRMERDSGSNHCQFRYLQIFLDGEFSYVRWQYQDGWYFEPPNDFTIEGYEHAELDEQIMLLLLNLFGGRMEESRSRELHDRVMGAVYFAAQAITDANDAILLFDSFRVFRRESCVHSWRLESAFNRLVKAGLIKDDFQSDDEPSNIWLTEKGCDTVARLALQTDLIERFETAVAAARALSPDLDAQELAASAVADWRARQSPE